jgi:ribonuclease-3
MDDAVLAKLQERLDIRFTDIVRLERALTHRSAATETPLESNERMEFLGDSVVGLVVCETLYERYPAYSEGDLAKSKAYVVSEAALADAALAMGLEEFLVLSESEAATGGRRRRSILADAFEALIAAVYLDCGIEVARRVVLRGLEDALRTAATEQHRRDYKSALQERTQAQNRQIPAYHILCVTGQEHDKTFTAEALLDGVVIGQGMGKSKKEAEQAAARDALTKLPQDSTPTPITEVPQSKNGVQ